MNTRFAKSSRRGPHTLLVAALVFVLCFIASVFIFPAFGHLFRTMLRPLTSVSSGIGSGFETLGAYFGSKAHMERRNQELENQITELQTRLLDRDSIALENAALQEILNRKVSEKFTLARVLVKPNRSLYDTVIIDIGKDNNLRVGAQVFAYGDVPIGTVATVDAKTSLVKLYSSPGEVVTGRIEGLDIDVTLTGRGGGNFEAELPREVKVTEGQNVVLPASTPLIIAKFGKEISDPRDPAQKFILTGPINMSELNLVEIGE